MRNTLIITIKKASLLAGYMFISSSLSVMADDVQDALNLDYFRTPEASAFMKYGETSVNEYTGTADISVPLYTIKCKDIEIPIVLRYDASGIKVEQEASWVGLGWNMSVGGCINYVCAGGHDQYTQCSISEQEWTEYLTNMKTPNSNGTQYFHYLTDDRNTWMETVPHSFAFDPPYSGNLSQDMKNYVMWGYGERDFYSVNVMGKSFKFFIDPVTLNRHIIGEAGEEFRVEPDYQLNTGTGIGNQGYVRKWTITDSDGNAYYFENSDTISDERGMNYQFCWYLTGIRTPSGETVELSYTQHQQWGRSRRSESFVHIDNSVSPGDLAYHPVGYAQSLDAGLVKNSYLSEIRTRNQRVTFETSDSRECSGRKLNAIKVWSDDGTLVKTIRFSYSSFGYSNIGGNHAPAQDPEAELRLKLDNVRVIASQDTLTTCFSYNPVNLPSKRSCAQDYWGYYNGQDNPSTNDAGYNGHTLVPTPKNFMTKYYYDELFNIKGADRYCRGDSMQAAMLNKVVYPTGGYTTYEYEPHRFAVNDYTQSQEYQEFINRPYDIDIYKSFSYTPYNYPDSFIVSNEPCSFTLSEELAFSLYVRCNGDVMNGNEIRVIIALAPQRSVSVPISIPVTYMSSNDPFIVLQDTLPAGDYLLMIGAPTNVNQGYAIGCWLKGYNTSTSSFNYNPQMTYTQTGGGLRIKKICNYDHDESPVNSITYDYDDENGSTGILLDEMETIEPFSFTYLKYEPNGIGLGTVYSRHPVSGCTISTGKTRFPAFFASCNPGNVGYSQVTKRIRDANGNTEKSVVTSYINHAPQSLTVMDYYQCFDNGRVLSQKTCNANGNTILKMENEYLYHDNGTDGARDRWYSTNMVCRDGLGIDPQITYINESGNLDFMHRFKIWKYPYILSRVELSKTISTEYCPDGSAIIKTKDYLYNATNHQVSQVDDSTDLPNQVLRTKITYSVDGTDNVSIDMRNDHRLNDVVESKNYLVENNMEKIISTKHTTYGKTTVNDTLRYYLPTSLSTSIGNETPEIRATYSYDEKRNVRSVVVDSVETVYIWSYKGQYPVAKIEGLTYAQVQAAIGSSTISNLLHATVPSTGQLTSIRNAVKAIGGLVTTYTFKPLVGIESQTLPNGYTVYYEYDAFGRLKRVIDHDGNIVSTNSYNYRHP